MPQFQYYQDNPGIFEYEVLAHEKGHRFGTQIIQEKLDPLQRSENVSEEASRLLRQYLKSENFAERTKVALGKSLGFDFNYNQDSDEVATIYRLNNRIGPEELVDPEREESLDELAEDIDRMLIEISEGVQDWA